MHPVSCITPHRLQPTQNNYVLERREIRHHRVILFPYNVNVGRFKHWYNLKVSTQIQYSSREIKARPGTDD